MKEYEEDTSQVKDSFLPHFEGNSKKLYIYFAQNFNWTKSIFKETAALSISVSSQTETIQTLRGVVCVLGNKLMW